MRHGKGTRVRSAGGDEKAASFCQKSRKSRFVRRATTRGEKHERTRRGGSPWGTVGRSARCAPRRRRSRRLVRPRHVAYLHDSRAVVRNGGDALVVVHELVQASRALRDRTGWSAEIRNQKGGAGDDVRICEPRGDAGTYQGGADGVHHRHARVDVGNQLAFALAGVRALAQEHDLGLLRGTGRGRQPRKAQIAATETKKIWQLAPRRAFERGA